MTIRRTNTATYATDLSAWAAKLDKIAFDDKHANISKDKTRKTSMRTNSPIIKQNRDWLRSLIQVEVKSDLELVQQEEMKSMSRNLVEVTICDVHTAR